jgi:hypothetical protein
MRIGNLRGSNAPAICMLLLATLWILPACSISVKKDQSGQDKRVDIETPVGALHVDQGADARDTGLPVYPGARPKQKDAGGDEGTANVNLSSGLFGLKVVAVKFQSDDSPQKLIAYYRAQLKKYGAVLECRSNAHGGDLVTDPSKDDSTRLKCEGDNRGKNIELKVGTSDNQRIVAIEPADRGTNFALVYIKMRGKDTI